MVKQMSEDMLWSQIVARAWCDEAIMKRLLSDPRAVLAEHNLELPEDMEIDVVEGTEVKVVSDTDKLRQFILPVTPPCDLTEEELIGGAVAWCGCAACRASAACARCAASAACGHCGACGCRCW
jgi:hypothetical protein